LTHKYIIIPVFIVALLLLFFGQELLVDVRDKLLFEQEYAGSIKEKVPPRSSLHIPWSWLPAVLCVLQEVIQTLLVKTFTRTTK
jgi:H+/gluconate symporter-like permease